MDDEEAFNGLIRHRSTSHTLVNEAGAQGTPISSLTGGLCVVLSWMADSIYESFFFILSKLYLSTSPSPILTCPCWYTRCSALAITWLRRLSGSIIPSFPGNGEAASSDYQTKPSKPVDGVFHLLLVLTSDTPSVKSLGRPPYTLTY